MALAAACAPAGAEDDVLAPGADEKADGQLSKSFLLEPGAARAVAIGCGKGVSACDVIATVSLEPAARDLVLARVPAADAETDLVLASLGADGEPVEETAIHLSRLALGGTVLTDNATLLGAIDPEHPKLRLRAENVAPDAVGVIPVRVTARWDLTRP